MKVQTRYLKILAFVLLGLMVMYIAGNESRRHYYINWTPSIPRGIYKLSPLQGDLRAGQTVLMKVPKEFEAYVYGRQWLPPGWPLLKHVGALPGENFCVIGSSFSIGGKLIAKVLPMDTQGLSLPHLQGCFKVRPQYFLPLATSIPNAFDGRYMADVPQSTIIALATPLWTF